MNLIWSGNDARKNDNFQKKLQFNDCIAAPDGSFLAGTFYPSNVLGYEKTGKLYRFFPNGEVEIISENHGCSNGMGFSPDLDYFYHSDPSKGKIVRHSYNSETNEIGQAEEWYEHNDDGGPDGMTVDSEGYVWSAIWGGSGVIRIDKAGNVVEKININWKHMRNQQESIQKVGLPHEIASGLQSILSWISK